MEDLTGISLDILRTIRQADLGKLGLISVFKGYKSRLVMQNKLYNLPGYGALYWLTPDGIKDVLSQLEAAGMVMSVNIGPEMGTVYRIPKVRLTEAGERALQEKIQIPLLADPKRRDLPKKSDTVLESIRLFGELRQVERVSEARGLKGGTIWRHLTAGVELGLIGREDIFSKDVLRKVDKAKKAHPHVGLTELKALIPEMSYEELRCALAKP